METPWYAPPYVPTPGLAQVRPQDGLSVVYVPSGEFQMGTDDEDHRDEQPPHIVALDAFWLDSTEVTNQQFDKFVEDTG